MTETRIRAILQELVEDNPFACRAVLRVLAVEFTTDVPTLAVTCEDRPRLLINLAFVSGHCHTDEHVKAVILHEFLHVLLRHTEDRGAITPARHLACDAVINAIIHRQWGDAYSSMMAAYYADARGVMRLLRPPRPRERLVVRGVVATADLTLQWDGLYAGTIVVDDIEDLVRNLQGTRACASRSAIDLERLLGNHDGREQSHPAVLDRALDEAMRQMNGAGIWRSPRRRGVGAAAFEEMFAATDAPLQQWRRATLAILKRHLQPDARAAAREDRPGEYTLPVLTPSDRRAFTRALWSPFLPDARWTTRQRHRGGSAHVYLDVSGSMWAEMPQIVSLLQALRRHIQRPFWAFSDKVAPATIENGNLKTSTTGGTSIRCVLEHVIATRPGAAVIVTDGYVETVNRKLAAAAQQLRLHVIVTRDGNPAQIRKAGLPYSQLDRMPA